MLKQLLSSGVIPAIIGGCCGWVTAYCQNKSATKVAIRNELVKKLELIANISYTYWAASGRDIVAETKIKQELHFIRQDIDRIKSDSTKFKAQRERTLLWRACTSGDFESNNRQPCPTTINNIRTSAQNLRDIFNSI
jgi:hypothetical protein